MDYRQRQKGELDKRKAESWFLQRELKREYNMQFPFNMYILVLNIIVLCCLVNY